MLIYMVYDKETGAIVHMHHTVDVDGRSTRSTDEEVMRALPPGVDAGRAGIVVTELDHVPSGREVTFSVDVERGALVTTPVQASPPGSPSKRPAAGKGSATGKGAATRKGSTTGTTTRGKA